MYRVTCRVLFDNSDVAEKVEPIVCFFSSLFSLQLASDQGFMLLFLDAHRTVMEETSDIIVNIKNVNNVM